MINSFKVGTPVVDIITFAEDPNYLNRKLYPAQREILGEFFNASKPYEELLLICGRDSTKTFMAALIACYVAYLWQEIPDPYYLYQGRVDRGKEVHILCIATKEEQATILLDEIKAKINSSPYFQDKKVSENNYEIVLNKNLHILAVTSNSASEVGKTAILVEFDEIGKYGMQSGTRDGEEVYDSLTPSVGRFASNRSEFLKRCAGDIHLEMIVRFLGRVVSISTPMGKSGILWRIYNTAKRLTSILMYQRATWLMNPNYPFGCSYLKNEEAKNARTFRREFGAEFDEAVDAMLDPELVDRCARSYRDQIEYILRASGNYFGAMDTSRKKDAFSFCIGHMAMGGTVIIDEIRYWIPVNRKLNWMQVKQDIVALCLQYGVEQILHDGYEGEAVKLYFSDFNLTETPFTMPYKMKIYQGLEDRMHQGQISYPDDDRLRKELKALQKKWNGENFTVHHPDSGPVTTDDGPDVIANLSYHLYNGYVTNHDSDYETTENRQEGSGEWPWPGDDQDNSVALMGGGGNH